MDIMVSHSGFLCPPSTMKFSARVCGVEFQHTIVFEKSVQKVAQN